MTKAELVKKIATKTNLTNAQAEAALAATIETITTQLAAGNAIQLTGIGRFSVKERAARTGRNPRTGAALTIPACKVVTFTASQALKRTLNG